MTSYWVTLSLLFSLEEENMTQFDFGLEVVALGVALSEISHSQA